MCVLCIRTILILFSMILLLWVLVFSEKGLFNINVFYYCAYRVLVQPKVANDCFYCEMKLLKAKPQRTFSFWI